MADQAKRMTVSFGAFSCTLDGFDDPFPVMKRIVEYFQEVSKNDPSFGLQAAFDAPAALSNIMSEDAGEDVTAAFEGSDLVISAASGAASLATGKDVDSASGADGDDLVPAQAIWDDYEVLNDGSDEAATDDALSDADIADADVSDDVKAEFVQASGDLSGDDNGDELEADVKEHFAADVALNGTDLAPEMVVDETNDIPAPSSAMNGHAFVSDQDADSLPIDSDPSDDITEQTTRARFDADVEPSVNKDDDLNAELDAVLRPELETELAADLDAELEADLEAGKTDTNGVVPPLMLSEVIGNDDTEVRDTEIPDTEIDSTEIDDTAQTETPVDVELTQGATPELTPDLDPPVETTAADAISATEKTLDKPNGFAAHNSQTATSIPEATDQNLKVSGEEKLTPNNDGFRLGFGGERGLDASDLDRIQTTDNAEEQAYDKGLETGVFSEDGLRFSFDQVETKEQAETLHADAQKTVPAPLVLDAPISNAPVMNDPIAHEPDIAPPALQLVDPIEPNVARPHVVIPDGSMKSIREFASSAGAATLPELLEASAAFVTLVSGRETFSRNELLTMMDEVPEGSDYSNEARIRTFSTMVNGGRIENEGGGKYALSSEARAFYEKAVSG